MSAILTQAQALVQELITLMPTPYQQDSLQALLGLFLAATGSPLPQYCQIKSASALSRFLNQYQWSTRKIINAVRSAALQQILTQPTRGRRPTLQVIIDLTTLEKRGKFTAFDKGIRVYHSKRGLHLVVMYLVVGQWRFPWNFRVYRGKNTPSPAHLGLRLLRSLPKALTQRFQMLVLADSAFSSIEFLQSVRKLKYHAITGKTLCSIYKSFKG